MKQIIVTNIKWAAPNSIAKCLPQRIVIDVTPDKEDMLKDMHDKAEFVSDYISDMIGWCHYGFNIEAEDVPDEN